MRADLSGVHDGHDKESPLELVSSQLYNVVHDYDQSNGLLFCSVA